MRPQDDLFRHVNGGWIAQTEIPADRAHLRLVHRSSRDKSEADLRAIIEDAAKADASRRLRGPQDRRPLRQLHGRGPRRANSGSTPIKDELARIDAIAGQGRACSAPLAALQREGVGGLFGLFVDTDAKQSDRYIVYLNQGGISLPDESYYRDAKFKPIREQVRRPRREDVRARRPAPSRRPRPRR